MSWFDENTPDMGEGGMTGRTPGQEDLSGFEGQLPTGYSGTEVADFLSRNPGDESRVSSALNDRSYNAAGLNPAAPNIEAPAYRTLNELNLNAPNFEYTPFSERFVAPDAQTIQSMPGYQARQVDAQKAIERSAAARGTLLTPGTMRALQQTGADVASQAYEGEYGRRMNEFMNRFNIDSSNQLNKFNTGEQHRMNDFSVKSFYDQLAEQQRNNTFNMANTNRMNTYGIASGNRAADQSERLNDFNIWNTLDSNYYNRLFGLAGMGQTAAGQQQAANQGYGAQGYDAITGGGNAQAAGTVGSANAWGGAASGIGSDLMMNMLLRNSGGVRTTSGGGGGGLTPNPPDGKPYDYTGFGYGNSNGFTIN